MKYVGITSCLVLLLCLQCAKAAEVTFVDPISILSGVLLADSFEGYQLDEHIWFRPTWMSEHNPYLTIGVQNGHLTIAGYSHPAGTNHQYVGIMSKYFRETDVVLVARMRTQSSFSGKGRLRHIIHLCSGDWPDFFTEVSFGTIDMDAPKWFTGYRSEIGEYLGYSQYVEPVRAATGSESVEWRTVVLQHDGQSGSTQNYMLIGKEWVRIGPEHKLSFNHTHIEIKVDANVNETPVWMEVSDVRLYPNPVHNPATIVIGSRVINNRSEHQIHNLVVKIIEDGSSRLLGQAITDEGGQARVLLRTDVAYPVAASVEVWDHEKQILRSAIPAVGVRGLYPGDVWVLRIPPFDVWP